MRNVSQWQNIDLIKSVKKNISKFNVIYNIIKFNVTSSYNLTFSRNWRPMQFAE